MSNTKHHSLSPCVAHGEGKVENLRGKEVTVDVMSAWEWGGGEECCSNVITLVLLTGGEAGG